MQVTIRCGIAIIGIPYDIVAILQELKGASADIAGMYNCVKVLPARSRPMMSLHTPSLDPDTTPILMQFLHTPQLLAAILSELHTSREHIAKMHARMRWLPKKRGSGPKTPSLQVSPTVCAIPENLAKIVTEIRAMRVDLAGMHARLQILPGPHKQDMRERSCSDPGTSAERRQTMRDLNSGRATPSHIFPSSPSNPGFLARTQTIPGGSRTTGSPSSSGAEAGPVPFSRGWLRHMCRIPYRNAFTPLNCTPLCHSWDHGDSCGVSSADGSFRGTDSSVPSPPLSAPECVPWAEGDSFPVAPRDAATASRSPAPGETTAPPGSTLASNSTRRGGGKLFGCASGASGAEPTNKRRREQSAARQRKGLKMPLRRRNQAVMWWEKITRKHPYAGA
jgi:hypothetical protein